MDISKLVLACALVFVFRSVGAEESRLPKACGRFELEKLDGVWIQAEEHFISSERMRKFIEIHYEGKKDAKVEMSISTPPILWSAPTNHLSVDVNGIRIEPTMGSRAFMRGRDITELLLKHSIPIEESPSIISERINTSKVYSQAAVQELRDVGVFIDNRNERTRKAWPIQVVQWEVRTTAKWKQALVPGKAVRVEYGIFIAHMIRPERLTPKLLQQFKKDYCIDALTLKAIQALPKNTHYLVAPFQLASAGYRDGVLPSFKLTLNKMEETTIPLNKSLLSVCWSGLKKTSLRTFTSDKTNFRPPVELKALFLFPGQNEDDLLDY